MTSPRFERLLHQAHTIGRDILASYATEVDRDARFPRESIAALRQARFLSVFVPEEEGGMGLNVVQVARLCEVLGQYCASSAMIFAMHQIQVACLVHHARSSAYFQGYLRRLVEEQRLIASATSEVGVGGDLRTSLCAVEVADGRFRLTKKAPVISYAEAADDILVTCRRALEAPAGDQVQVLLHRDDFKTDPISGWDTLGFRGTCSSGFILNACGDARQILPVPFADILSRTMHPFSHVVWSALWAGLAFDAVKRARAFVRAEARKTPGETPLSALRLAEVDSALQEMRHNVVGHAQDYDEMLQADRPEVFDQFGFSIRTNNLKVSISQRVIDVVSRALLICGIAGYRNDSKYSLSRHLRDAYGAALMVNNDRILKLNATLLTAHKEGQ